MTALAEQLSAPAREFVARAHLLLIAGARVPAADGRTSETLDPATAQPITKVVHGCAEDAQDLLQETFLRAYEKLGKDPPPLLMVGEGLYARDLVRDLQAHASERIRFPGAIYGADYRTLQRNALLYIQATEVGGTHPALIEAMGSGGSVLAHDTPENREVAGDSVGYFRLRPEETLSQNLRDLLNDPSRRDAFRDRARKRAAERYSWAAVTDSYERLFREVTGNSA